MAEREFDAIVIGAGPAGEVAAGRMADGGLDVALVEPELVGGECSFWACMPSKALLRPAALLAEVGRVPGLPVEEGGSLDAARVIERRNEVVHDYDDSAQLPWLEDRGIALVRARGALDGERRVLAGPDAIVGWLAAVAAAVAVVDGQRRVGQAQRGRRGDVRQGAGTLAGRVAGVVGHRVRRRVDDQDTSRPGGGHDGIHARGQRSEAAGGGAAPVIVPHVAQQQRRRRRRHPVGQRHRFPRAAGKRSDLAAQAEM